LLQTSSFACVVVSHDRYFLENVATDMAELNRTYPDGVLRVSGSYSRFLEKKEEFLHAQSKRQEALENLVHREIEWLRRGAKARTRKSKARIDKAGGVDGRACRFKCAKPQRNRAQSIFRPPIEKTKRLIELQRCFLRSGDRKLFTDLNFLLPWYGSWTRGPNGSERRACALVSR